MAREPLSLHVPEPIRAKRWAMAQFYGPLTSALEGRGITVRQEVLETEGLSDRLDATPGFHILHTQRLCHPRALISAKAYIEPFYTLDPQGYRMFSSTGARAFVPSGQPARDRAVFDDIHARMVLARRSHYEQPEARIEVPEHVIAVFLQAEEDREVGEKAHLTFRRMVKSLIERPDPRPIIVKPHPRDSNFESYEWLHRQTRKDGRVQLFMGNIHDLLEKADVVVTINSAVGIEAMAHRKPVILCGDCDFHHICEVVRHRHGMDAAIGRAEARLAAGQWPFEAYLGWFFGQVCLDVRAPDFANQILARIAAQGFDPARLGVAPG